MTDCGLRIKARQELYKKFFLVAHSGRSQAPAPSPSHPWWMKQVIKEFELRSFSRDFLSRLLNRQPMNGPLLTNTALLHVGWANRHHCGDRWKRHMNGQCSLPLWESHYQLTLHGLCVWESGHPPTNPLLFPRASSRLATIGGTIWNASCHPLFSPLLKRPFWFEVQTLNLSHGTPKGEMKENIFLNGRALQGKR